MATLRNASMFLIAGLASSTEQPFWGCGMLGGMPGINVDGSTSTAMQTMIDGLKVTNKYDGKVAYWNWNYAPMDNDAAGGGGHQYLTKDFVFMPENWGIGAAEDEYVRTANQANFLDSSGTVCKGTMADIFLGANEPDIYGSCMGDMMGACTGPCTDAETASGCPTAHLQSPQGSGSPTSAGHCDCYTDSHATGVGFWPVSGVSAYQPLPTCWQNSECISSIMSSWKKTAATVSAKGYKYLSAPLVAVNMDWMRSFVEKACTGCSDISCGCPTHIGWHFYADDCRPDEGGYADFQKKLDATVQLMEAFPHIQGAIVNEVGMLNCAMDTPDAICIPDGPDQKYPALSQPNHACPSTSALPNGLGSFVEHLLQQAAGSVTSDGRRAVVSFTWFNLDMSGGTYNLRLFNDDGTINEVGKSYISACQAWASATNVGPSPTPAPPSPAQPTPAPPTPSGRNASCTAPENPKCNSLSGDCCPASDGTMLDCCSSASTSIVV
jgi:hypothetical protein